MIDLLVNGVLTVLAVQAGLLASILLFAGSTLKKA
jgi:hypothetical protein